MRAAAAAFWLLAALPALAGGRTSAVAAVPAARPVPEFSARQATSVLGAVGQAATLDCRVLYLGDKSVSWVRSRDLQILSHAGLVFTADARVSAAEARADDADAADAADDADSADGADGADVSSHVLRVERLRLTDSGRYECQVNTDPKLSLFFNLTVLEEAAATAPSVSAVARVVRGARGGAATLACAAHLGPRPGHARVAWRRAGRPLRRAALAVDTERWGAARLESRLTLAGLAPEDAGRYECRLLPAGVRDEVTLRVTDEDGAEAMQHDQAAATAAASAAWVPAAPAAWVPASPAAWVPAAPAAWVPAAALLLSALLLR